MAITEFVDEFDVQKTLKTKPTLSYCRQIVKETSSDCEALMRFYMQSTEGADEHIARLERAHEQLQSLRRQLKDYGIDTPKLSDKEKDKLEKQYTKLREQLKKEFAGMDRQKFESVNETICLECLKCHAKAQRLIPILETIQKKKKKK